MAVGAGDAGPAALQRLAQRLQGEAAVAPVEIDGAYFGGYIKPENRKEDRKDRRLKANQNGKRKVVVVMRERGGRTLPFVFKAEDDAILTIRERVLGGSIIYADEASCWSATRPV